MLATPLLGADGNVYAVAQGAISLAGFTPVGCVKTKLSSVDTNGYIQSSGIVENEIDFSFRDLQTVKFSLYSPDFTTAIRRVTGAINDNVPGNTAGALDASTVEVTVPSYRQGGIVEFVAEIEGLEVKPDYKVKIVVNESTDTVVIGDKVNIRPVAIVQGNIIVNVGQSDVINKKYGPDTDEKNVI